MAARRNANRIRGPQSALTDFLAANNISAQQIRDTYEARHRTARQQNAPDPVAEADEQVAQALQETEDLERAARVAAQAEEDEQQQASSSKKRKRKPTKDDSAQKSKNTKKTRPDESDDDYEDLETSLGREMYRKARVNPGQLDFCELCSKRFTVTAYTKTGPDGGLVCGPCGRDLVREADGGPKKPKKSATGKGRRKVESNRLDGITAFGAKSLQQMCIERVADHHLDIDEFGDLPTNLLDRLSGIFSKRRVLDSRTSRLFLRPDMDVVAIHDCAKLESDDYEQIFAVVPKVKRLVLRNACQFKDACVEYMIDKATELTHVKIYGANLVTDDMWSKFFHLLGPQLESLELEWLDAAFDDDIIKILAENCTRLQKLKLKHCRRITDKCLATLAGLKQLKHLSLHIFTWSEENGLDGLVKSIGSSLETLSIENLPVDERAVEAIRQHCSNLRKLRLTPLDAVSDACLSAMFGANPSAPTVLPPLRFVDLTSAREVDNNNPNGTEDNIIGLASESFNALIRHSGLTLQTLHIPSCRHISHDALWEAFVGEKTAAKGTLTFPELQEINVSFVSAVDTSVVSAIFKNAPQLKKVVAFGCFRIEDVVVPGGVALIGVPRAQDAIEQYGDAFAIVDDSSLAGLFARTPGRALAVGA